MKKLGFLVLLMFAAGPVAAQDASPAPAADEAAGFGTGEDAAADAAAAETDAAAAETDAAAADAVADQADAAAADADAASDEAAATDASSDATAEAAAEAPAEAAATEETVAVDETAEAAAEESGDSAAASTEEESDPWQLYVGTDYVWTRARFSSDALKTEFGGDDFDSNMIRGRVGMRLFDSIGVEVHLGAGTDSVDDLEAGDYSTEEFYGAYLVPTGVLFDLIEVGAAIGVAHTKLETATASETLSGVSFGVNLEIPLYSSEAVELRIGGGGTMFRAQNSAQISGYHAGIRVDFRI